MPRRCCVPGCKSNYDSQKEAVSTFCFPTDPEKRKLWLQKIGRSGESAEPQFEPTKHTAVCVKHFREKFIVRTSSATRPDGSILTVPRAIPKLSDDALPSIFPNLPSHTTHEPPTKGELPVERMTYQNSADRDFTERLVAEVKLRPCLYNPQESGYKDRTKVDAGWQAVASALGCTSDVAKRRWQNLRGSYSRSRGHRANTKRPAYYMAEQLRFLDPHMPHLSAETDDVEPPGQLPLDVAESLINAVRNQELLYDFRKEGYKDASMTEQAWQAVSEETGRDVHFCRGSWTKLKSIFKRILEKKRLNQNGVEGTQQPKWYLYKQMIFLKDFVSPGDTTVGNLSLFKQEDSMDSSEGQYLGPSLSASSGAGSDDELDYSAVAAATAARLSPRIPPPHDREVADDRNVMTMQFMEQPTLDMEPVVLGPPSKKRKKDKKADDLSTTLDPVQKAFLDLLRKKSSQIDNHQSESLLDQELLPLRGIAYFIGQLTEKNKRIFISKTTSLVMELLDSQD
ncbi:THAP domain containing protein [Plakobranchus ocellatus]|uniref:THAP domain containing protein n=1 Tax=Plakobranchus ocellatus TaxID=259542 RepID=A0AAV4DUN5_9GAST|nr:THAP domain containing protein [Plakobranchus ocellatus]